MVEGPGADSEEKREPVRDIDTAVVDSLKVLDPNRPIREAEVGAQNDNVRSTPAGSTGRRNTGVKSLRGGFKLQGVPRPFVELTCHFVQVGLRVHR